MSKNTAKATTPQPGKHADVQTQVSPLRNGKNSGRVFFSRQHGSWLVIGNTTEVGGMYHAILVPSNCNVTTSLFNLRDEAPDYGPKPK